MVTFDFLNAQKDFTDKKGFKRILICAPVMREMIAPLLLPLPD